jgi:putative peptidoglycan lipid II flippase
LALIAYGVGLPAFVGTKILQPAFYAAGQAKLVLKISLVSVLINLCLSLLLMQSLGHAGLALATSLSFWIVFIWQAAMLRRQKKLDFTAGLFMAKALTASLVMAAGLIAIQMHLNKWLSFSEVLGPRLQLGLLVVSGLILYGVSAVVLKIAPKLR